MYGFEVLTSSGSGGQHVTQGTSRLYVSTIGIDVNVSDGFLDANADTQSSPRVRVKDVDKVSVVRRKSFVGFRTLKHGTSRV